MEFIKTDKYKKGNFKKPISFDDLKTLEKVKVNQKLELLPDTANIALLDKYAKMGLKVIPIRRISSRDWSQRKDFPNRVLLEMTSRCNYNCRMCPRYNLTRPRIDFDKDLYLKVIDELDQHGIQGIWLFNLGEPILHPDWKEIVDYVGNKKNIEMIWFSTNGFAFDSDCADFVLKSNITFLNYSLHGTNSKTYGYVAPKINYKTVRKNLEYLLKKKQELGQGPIVHIQMIDQAGTHDNINEFLETFYQTGEIVSINALEYANLPNNQYGLSRKRPSLVKKCNRLSRGDCFIVSNGDIQPCEAAYNGEIPLGNVKEKPVKEIWNSPIRLKMLKLNDKGELFKIDHCSKCTDYDL
ncbi:MAG: radical SAM protein [Candidatus Zambryskibacteria bacterium]